MGTSVLHGSLGIQGTEYGVARSIANLAQSYELTLSMQ